MPNLVVTKNNPFGLIIEKPFFRDELVGRDVAFTADTILKPGTVLRRTWGGGNLQYNLIPAHLEDIVPTPPIALTNYPVAILMEELDLTVPNVPLPTRVLISGTVREDSLFYYVNETTAPLPVTKEAKDMLKVNSIIAIDVQQLAELDNN